MLESVLFFADTVGFFAMKSQEAANLRSFHFALRLALTDPPGPAKKERSNQNIARTTRCVKASIRHMLFTLFPKHHRHFMHTTELCKSFARTSVLYYR